MRYFSSKIIQIGLSQDNVHQIVEAQALAFLKSMGLDATRVNKKPNVKTPDYSVGELAIEVTTVHDYDHHLNIL